MCFLFFMKTAVVVIIIIIIIIGVPACRWKNYLTRNSTFYWSGL